MKYLNLGNTGQLFFNLENRNVLFFFFLRRIRLSVFWKARYEGRKNYQWVAKLEVCDKIPG